MALDGISAELLSDEERAAIEDGLTEDEVDAIKTRSHKEGEVSTDDDDDDGDEDDGEEGAAAGAEEGAQTDEGDGEEAPPERERRSYRATLPEGYDEKVAAVAQESDALADRFKAGDIDFDEYRAEAAKLDSRRDELAAAKLKAEISAEMEDQSAERQWQDEIDALVSRAAKDDKVDYRNDPEKQRDLDVFVRVLAADATNASRPMRWFLDEAHKRVKALHGLLPAQKSEQSQPPSKPAPRKPNLAAVPKTLANIPGGDGPGDIADEFSGADGLEGLDFEAAIAKMSPAQREKFARA